MKIQIKRRRLVYTNTTVTKLMEGSLVMIITLKRPIKEVIGSQHIFDFEKRELLDIRATDVRELWVHEHTAKHIQIDTKTKTICFKMLLDVSKTTNRVWITDETFEVKANAFRAERRAGFARMLRGRK
jgi:hypothetical protein